MKFNFKKLTIAVIILIIITFTALKITKRLLYHPYNVSKFGTFDKNKPYDRPIVTIIDNWNHDKILAELVHYPRIYEAAYILQQSGFRRTFAFKTTYEVSTD